MVQQRGGIGKRIRAVGDDKAVVPAAVFPYRAGDRRTVSRGQVGRVQVHQVAYPNRTDPVQLGHETKQLFPCQRGRKPVFSLAAGDRPAGCDQ